MDNYIEYLVTVPDQQLREILIARLADAGAGGFEEERTTLKVFLPEGANQADIESILQQSDVPFQKTSIAYKNWNEEWEAGFSPVIIDNFCCVRASFHPSPRNIEHDIVINPKMSFGTGHHATTRLMIMFMAGLDFRGKTVIDFGTGTGVLAILAEQCGASAITALDNDEWSIENATENFSINKCDKIILINSNELNIKEHCDIILANINRNVILQQMGLMKQHLAPNGVLLLSGLLATDEPVIAAALENSKLKLIAKKQEEDWIALMAVNE